MPDADINTLLVAPRHINRSEFFSSFLEMLQEEKGVKNVTVSSIIMHQLLGYKMLYIHLGKLINNCLGAHVSDITHSLIVIIIRRQLREHMYLSLRWITMELR